MSGECDNCSEHTIECKCNRAITSNGWVSVKEHFPFDDTEVLTYGQDKWYGAYCAAYYDGRCYRWHDGGPIKQGVTHWMPLPLPPL